MAITTINDTAFHEAGHSLITYLNDDFFYFEYVTIDKDFSKIHNNRSIGGIKGRLLKEPNKLSLVEHDKLCICSLAGLAADDINHNNGKISEEFYKNSIWAEKMSSNKYLGDKYILGNHFSMLSKDLIVEQRVYTKSCQELLYKMFTDENILTILLDLRNLIFDAKTIRGDKIKIFLDSTSLKSWKKKNWGGNFATRKKILYNNNLIHKFKYKLKKALRIKE